MRIARALCAVVLIATAACSSAEAPTAPNAVPTTPDTPLSNGTGVTASFTRTGYNVTGMATLTAETAWRSSTSRPTFRLRARLAPSCISTPMRTRIVDSHFVSRRCAIAPVPNAIPSRFRLACDIPTSLSGAIRSTSGWPTRSCLPRRSNHECDASPEVGAPTSDPPPATLLGVVPVTLELIGDAARPTVNTNKNCTLGDDTRRGRTVWTGGGRHREAAARGTPSAAPNRATPSAAPWVCKSVVTTARCSRRAPGDPTALPVFFGRRSRAPPARAHRATARSRARAWRW